MVETHDNAQLGLELRQAANALTHIRSIGAQVVAGVVLAAPNYHGLEMALVQTALETTDIIDGRLGRESDNLLGIEGSIENKRYDEITDKKSFHWTFGSIALRSLADSETSYAELLLGLQAVVAARDVSLSALRSYASTRSIDAGSTAVGKAKTWVFGAAKIFALSPLARKHTSEKLSNGQKTVVGLVATGALLALVSEAQIAWRVYKQAKQDAIQIT